MSQWFIIALGGYTFSFKMNLNLRSWLGEHYRPRANLLLFLSADASGVSIRIIRDMETKSLVIFDICSFAEVLEQPLELAWNEIPAYTELTLQLLRAFSRKKTLTRNEGTWLAFQIAYLKALAEVLQVEIQQEKSWLDRALFTREVTNATITGVSLRPPVKLEHPRLVTVLKTLYPGKLTDTQAEQALELVSDSLLAQQMQNAVITWLIANGAEEMEAKLISQRIAIALTGHLLTIVAENAAALPQLQKFLRLGNICLRTQVPVNFIAKANRRVQPGGMQGDWIDLPRERYRGQLIRDLAKPLYGEFFALPDIYVPPKGVPIGETTISGLPISSVDLFAWLQGELADFRSITWIEAESGCGKTSFLRMFAAHVARHLYPEWMPIVVRLRDIQIGTDFLASIASGFPQTLAEQVQFWLDSESIRCLVLLDGLEELPKKQRQILVRQLLQFQSHSLHKFVITARCREFEQLEQTTNLTLVKRVLIQPFQQEEWKQWFQNWAKVQSLNIAQGFFGFLKTVGAFTSIHTERSSLPQIMVLVSQPLMLYLLAVLHREGLLEETLLQTATTTAKHRGGFFLWEMGMRLQRWLLGYPENGGVKTALVREGMAHIYGNTYPHNRLYNYSQARQLYSWIQQLALQNWRSQRYITTPDQQFLLPNFLLQHSPTHPQQIEFSHPYLQKLITATAIASELSTTIHPQANPKDYAEFCYDLFGSNLIDWQLQELILETLRRQPPRHGILAILREKLLEFWQEYQRSTWLDQGIAYRTLEKFQNYGNSTHIETIHAYVGINTFFLLSSLHQETKTTFFPGGIPNTSDFNPHAIAELIARTNLIAIHTFSDRTHANGLQAVDLSHMNLSGTLLNFAHLNSVNLSNANLTDTNLTGADLTGADLTNANLSGANLTRANLSHTNLIGANLSGANLTEVIFNTTNLTNACLAGAILSESDRETACLQGAIFSQEDFFAIKRLLSQHELSSYTSEYGHSTSIWMGVSGMVAIETSEGEILSEEEYEDETVVNNYEQEV